MIIEVDSDVVPPPLGDGRVLRAATPADADRLGRFTSMVYGGSDADASVMQALAADLLDARRPGIRPRITLVEDGAGDIVSTASLIPQTWSYSGTVIRVDQIETVATHPEHRRQGLVRHQFKWLHQISDQRGSQVRVIAGIPHYYHQFGYDYGLLQAAGRVLRLVDRQRRSGQFQLRPAVASDSCLLSCLSEQAGRRLLISCPRDEEFWKYELTGHRTRCLSRFEVSVIEHAGHPVGAVATTHRKLQPRDGVFLFEVMPEISLLDVVPEVLGHLADRADGRTVLLLLGEEHPVYAAAPTDLQQTWPGTAWYVQIPEIAGFLRTIRDAATRNLADSVAARTTTVLTIDLYDTKIRLHIDGGAITNIDHVAMDEPSDAAIPRASFVQLVLGYRGLEALEASTPDCWCANDRTRIVLSAMFPARQSNAWQFL